MSRLRSLGAGAREYAEIFIPIAVVAAFAGLVMLLGSTQTSQVLETISKPV